MENGHVSSVSESLKKNLKSSIKYTQLFIDGEFVDSKSGKKFTTYDPSTQEAIIDVAEADGEDVDLAVKAARRAFDEGEWPRLSGLERGKIISKFADLMEQNLEEINALESYDNGMPVWLSNLMNQTAILTLRYNASMADKLSGEKLNLFGPFDAFEGYTLLEPIGVVGAIIPWNLPLLMFITKVGAALVCGNTVVIKPSELTPLTALYCTQLAHEAGLPAGALNVVPGYGRTAGAAISSHMDIDKVTFTGSADVGRLVMEAAAKSNLKQVTLELGGKSPLIVCDDANLDAAVETAHNGLFTNQGQACIASSRILVHENLYDEFVEKVAARAKQLTLGDPLQPGVTFGPVINQLQFDKILSYIECGKEQGARLILGGSRAGSKGFFIEPTIFADVEDTMTIAKEEIFGPVMSVMKFSSLEEAIQRANCTKYGLASGVVTKNEENLKKLTKGIKAGLVFLNTYYDGLGPSVPFGGCKQSGFGRENGIEGLKNFLQIKSVVSRL